MFSANQYHLTVSRAQVSTHRVRVFFFEGIRWQVDTFQMIAGSSSIFFKCIWNKSCYMSRTFKMLISNWSRTRKFNRLLHLQAGKVIAFDFSHCHALITLYVQFLCSDWSKFDRWVYAENFCSVWKLAYWYLELREFCVILWCFKLSFSTWCTKWNTAAIKIVL